MLNRAAFVEEGGLRSGAIEAATLLLGLVEAAMACLQDQLGGEDLA